jgi:NAD(P)H dehydrogenase (quinone)
MNIGIVVYSQTGNTYSVAQKLMEKLLTSGHTVNIERIATVDGKAAHSKNIQLRTNPDIDIYDALIFCSPVQGFSLSPVFVAYLSKLSSLENRKIACFVTQLFPYSWMGGKNAITKMKSSITEKRGTVSGTGIINWSRKLREKQIVDMIEELSRLF